MASVPRSLTDLARGLGIVHQRRVWTKRASGWDANYHPDHADNPALARVVDAVVAAGAAGPASRVVDLGAGSGQLSIPLARTAGHVLAVDISPTMIELLRANASAAGISNIEVLLSPIESLDIPAGSVDLVVSNYALHHLRDPDKAAAIKAAAGWLRPGGKVVIGDMMFGRGASARDREIIASKASAMLAKGPAGWWRLGKNAFRYVARVQERPISVGRWVEIFIGAGFSSVSASPVVAEAAIVCGVRPA
ncbi:MAG: class I SAM-dependent methyltransferase [Acidimicrobiales bacterium]